MLSSRKKATTELSWDERLFAQQVARSVIEIQPSVDNVADIVVMLEVLGYNTNSVKKYGFKDLFDLAKYVYGFIDAYENKEKNVGETLKPLFQAIPDVKHRFVEAIGLIFPWLGSLILLFITGVSLWLAWGLPIQISTALIGGVFLGLLIAEGLQQNFSRTFGFYFEQTNICEVKRLIKRTYSVLSIILIAVAITLYLIAYLKNLPFELVTITVASTATISLHRLSFMTINGLKKIGHLVIAYSAGFASLLLIYYFSSALIPDATTRYFAALLSAFVILSSFAIHHHLKILRTNFNTLMPVEQPHFYKAISTTDKTLKSRFNIQVLENFPYSLLGIFYFAMMFTDRIISWFFNSVTATTGQTFPIVFNSVYHTGADFALIVLLPSSIIQFIMTSPIFRQINNMSVVKKISEVKEIDKLIQRSYGEVLTYSIIASIITACILNTIAPEIIHHTATTQTSLHILLFASIGNIFLSIFMANNLFLTLVNRVKSLAIIAIVCTAEILSVGIILGKWNIENIAISYLISTVIAAVASSLYARKTLKNSGSIFFARFT